ncbi:MAG: ornithine cyclodeaminase family protein [Deltaproteobacteria bacterium]|nr:ornithine cyclodeaminase family protein [Deltaproteobacteria bacterium]
MLLLSNEEIESLVSVESCLGSLERAYKAHADGKAINRPRSDLYLPGTTANGVYAFKSMEGGLVESQLVALRLNSDVIRWERRGDRLVKEKGAVAPGGKWVGLILLFSAQTGEPLAIFPDGVIQRWRVAGTGALAARYLARDNASVLGIYGAGWQASAHVPMMCGVRKIKKVQVYSPTETRRIAFCNEMENKTGVSVVPVASPEAARKDADILVAATNAVSRVIAPGWLVPGVHVTCVKTSELGDETIRRADRVVIHTRKLAPENYIAGLGDEKIECHDPVEFLQGQKSHGSLTAEAPFWADSPELKDIVAGRIPGRESAGEITCFINNIGLGLQFAALGGAVYTEARRKGIGREIPTDWFLETVHP